jgi:hypothetical protein
MIKLDSGYNYESSSNRHQPDIPPSRKKADLSGDKLG